MQRLKLRSWNYPWNAAGVERQQSENTPNLVSEGTSATMHHAEKSSNNTQTSSGWVAITMRFEILIYEICVKVKKTHSLKDASYIEPIFFSIWRSLEWIIFNGSISASVQRFSSVSFWSLLEWWARMARRNTWHSTRARWSPTSTRSGKRTGGSHESGSHNNLRPRQPPIVVLRWPHNKWDN